MKAFAAINILCIIWLTGCGVKGNTEKKVKDIELPVFELQSRDTILHRSYVASINAFQHVELRAKASGFLENIMVDEGQFVHKGQLMFTLNDAEFKVQVSEAKASLTSAQAEVNGAEVEVGRVKSLVDKKIVTPSDLELANAKLAAAKAKVDEALAKQEKARINLSYTTVRAPFDGIIDRILQKRGSLITEGSLLTSVSDIHAMHVYFKVSEKEYLNYVKGKKERAHHSPAILELADGSIYKYPGKIETMEGEFDTETGSIAFRAVFPNPSKLLKHGASGNILLTSNISNALMVPQRSVLEIQDRNFVFVLGADYKVRMKSFVPESRIDDFVLVKTGLAAGDRIIYEGVQNIKEGSTVKPRMIAADSILAIQ
ncbi:MULTISPECIES: efflux RND transporter periplasmic adaptor subunit [Niastella]|uniref:Efflux RND transporter periplasmic adaptor subunit n=1 Tax=Niastella soli TaxID=2821487 RepID=A0ABS3YSY5_9BACT|nr:efflux RND transporter periplasmic adaptor subunit [Niastella soli]MBO9200545.1 efflux RND transporter periplasmic adaptor subunit [Niastella soli]